MTGTHARLAPSNAERWGPGGCPGSVEMQARYPDDQESEVAREGTAAHHYLSETLRDHVITVGSLAPNGVPIDASMIDCATDFTTDIDETLAECSVGTVLRIEERVDMSESVHPDNYGTPDAYIIDWARKHVYVADYKYGHGYVPAFRNMQCINYACGVLECNGVAVADWTGWRIHITIAQPRNYAIEGPLRKWAFGGAQLAEYAAALKRAAYEALSPGAELRTGPHCDYCSAMVHCPASQALAGRGIDLSRNQGTFDMDAAAIGLQRRMVVQAIKRLKAIDDGLAAEMEAMICRGERVPGWGAGQVQSRERWALPIAEVVGAVKLMTGIDISKSDALTPAQARKAGVDQAVISEYAERPRGAMRIEQIEAADNLRFLGPR